MYTDNNNTAFKLKGDFLLLKKKMHSGGLLRRIGGAVSSAG